MDCALRSLCELTGRDEESDLAPPSEDFVLRNHEEFETDDGQIDGGVRYSVLLQVLVDFLATDGGTALPKDGLQDGAGGSVVAEPAAEQRIAASYDAMVCRPCKL